MSVNIYQNGTLIPIAGKTVPMPTPDYVDEQYNPSVSWTKGQTCISGNKRYRCKVNNTGSAYAPPNTTYWEELSVADELKGGSWNAEKIGYAYDSRSSITLSKGISNYTYLMFNFFGQNTAYENTGVSAATMIVPVENFIRGIWNTYSGYGWNSSTQHNDQLRVGSFRYTDDTHIEHSIEINGGFSVGVWGIK